MPDPILIREASRPDWPALERLIRASWHADYSACGEVVLGLEEIDAKVAWLKDEFGAFGSKFLVAEDAGKIAGLAICHASGDRVWIDDLFIAASMRRQGIATALIGACAPRDAQVCAEVNAKNAGAIAMFQKLGYDRAVETIVFVRAPQE